MSEVLDGIKTKQTHHKKCEVAIQLLHALLAIGSKP